MLNQAEEILRRFDESEKDRAVILTECGELAQNIARNAKNRKLVIFEVKEENNTELLLNKIRFFKENETMIFIEEKHNEYESAKKIKEDGFRLEFI